MQNQELLDEGMAAGSSGLELNASAKNFLVQTTKWAKFLAILGFVFSGIVIIVGLAFGSIISKLSSVNTFASGLSGFIGIVYTVMGLIMLYPALRLFQFARNGKIAVDENSAHALEESMRRIRSFFRFYGIVMIVYLVFIGIAVLSAISGIFN